MICPVCDIEMIAVERSAIELDSCISCRGLWLDAGELELLAETTGVPTDALDAGESGGASGGRGCPRCGMRLEERIHGPLRIDRCPAGDGFWFDRGELGALFDRGLAAAGALAPLTRFLGEFFGAPPAEGREQEERGR